MAKKLTNVETYIGIVFIFFIIITALIYLGNEVKDNTNAKLDNNSIVYIAKLKGTNATLELQKYNVDSGDVKESLIVSSNASQGNPKDQALEFLYSKEKSYDYEVIIKVIFQLPQTVIELFGFELNDWKWITNWLNWVFDLLIGLAILYLITGRNN